jgi:predicted Zn-dependent peptidase
MQVRRPLAFIAAAMLLAAPAPSPTARAADAPAPARPPAAQSDQAAAAPRFEEAFMSRVREHVLANGLRLLVLERHEVPVVSFVTMANVGSVDEHVGITGVAHIFEHMAFKGSREIGTTDYKAEQNALAAVDEAFDRMNAEKEKGAKADPKKVEALESEYKRLVDAARRYVVNNEYSVIVERNGGTGLNASTGSDSTQYFVSFPSNKLELWFMLEADRFREPVLREFYTEKDVVYEERRMRTESSPIGKLIEEFLAVAFKAHPYGYPTIGHGSDIQHLTRREAAEFFRAHYVPNNLTVAIVGDVDFGQCVALAEKYFGTLERGPDYRPVTTVEPPQEGEKRVEVESPAQPFVGIGWHRPAASDPDDAVYDVIQEILAGGRSSRLYTRLVKEKQIALQAAAFTGFPGQKYPNLFVVYGLPSVGHTTDELEKALIEETDRLTKEPPAADELARVKTEARAGFIRSLASNHGLALSLATAQTIYGDWREAFRGLRKLEAVTADDVLRVSKALFQKKNRVVGKIVAPEGAAAANH